MAAKYISPVAIDLGAKHTGVFLAHYESGTDPAKGVRAGTLIAAPDGGKQWSQRDRTSKRHQRRSYKRAKLAKRLLRLILSDVYKLDLERPIGPNQTAEDWFNSLLNNRGYTYLSEEIDHELLDRTGPTIVHLCWPNEFHEEQTLLHRLRELSGDLATAARLREEMPGPKEFFKRPAVQLLITEHFPEKSDRERQKEIYNETRDALDRLIKAQQEGHYRRQEYLDNIRADIANQPNLAALLQPASLTAAKLANLIGHVSNLQLRPLRRYFNDAAMAEKDRWDEPRMAKFFWNYVESWRPSEEERGRRRALLAHRDKPLLDVWLEVDPKLSVPPFEDQDNRRPPRCQSLLLDPQKLEEMLPAWQVITRKLLTANPGIDEELENRPLAKGWPMKTPAVHPWRGDENYLARLLQRVLDRSRERDRYSLRLLVSLEDGSALSQRAQNARAELERHIGSQHVAAFLDFAARYYEEARAAREGSWDPGDAQNLMRRCDLHPPRKSKQRERLIGAILGTELADAEALRAFLREPRVGRSTVRGIAARAADAQKEYGNALKEIFQRNRWLERAGHKPENKEVLKLFEDCRAAAQAIGAWLGQEAERWENYASPFSLAQLHNILETDIHGFSSTCDGCSRENAWRSRVNAAGAAHAVRLPVDSVRPFDGVLRRLLDAQAYDIAQTKAKQIVSSGAAGETHVPILIEENRFQFAESLAEIKRSAKKKRDLLRKKGEEQAQSWLGKEERIKAASNGICPYTGKPLGDDGQIDHILPQSETRKWHGTAYNSEANLIYVSGRGNTDKGNKIYDLDNLHPGYLQKQFGTKDPAAITARISTTLRPYFEKEKTYTSFLDLSPEEQLCLRHALFAPELRGKAIGLLQTQSKARVNGTQKWFARRIISHLKRELQSRRAGSHVSFSIHRVSAEDVHRARRALAGANPVFAKTDPQPAASHVIDATLAFACGLQDPQLADVLTWPLDDELEQRIDWLSVLLPSSTTIQRLESKPMYRKQNPEGQKLFKDKLFGERFLALLLDRQGRLGVGFEPKNCLWIEKGQESWFELLQPFLCFRGEPVKGNLAAWQTRAREAGKSHLYFTVDKTLAFEHLYQVAKKPMDERALQQADLLDGLRYVVQKLDLSKALVTPDGKRFKERNEILKADAFEITVKFAGGHLPRTMHKPNGKLELPARRDWERLLQAPAIKSRLGGETKDFNWRGELERIFPSAPSNRKHKAVRKDYSLPVIAFPSGGFRVRRLTPGKRPVWQTMSIGEYSVEGFEVEADGKLGAALPLAIVRKSRSLVGVGQRHRPEPQRVVWLDEWCEIPVDRKTRPWLQRLEYAPGTKDRFYVRATLTFADFKQLVLPFAVNGAEITHPFQLPSELKIVEPKRLRERLGEWLGQPRSNIFVTRVGETVTFWYIVVSTTAAMRERYEKARRESDD